jgi:hypothetical protein
MSAKTSQTRLRRGLLKKIKIIAKGNDKNATSGGQ